MISLSAVKRGKKQMDEIIDLFSSTYARLETESVRHTMVSYQKLYQSYATAF